MWRWMLCVRFSGAINIEVAIVIPRRVPAPSMHRRAHINADVASAIRRRVPSITHYNIASLFQNGAKVS